MSSSGRATQTNGDEIADKVQANVALKIGFEGCLNFRDLGGYETADGHHVASGRLFRSMTPEYMTGADVQRARDELGIRLVLDLRNNEARTSGPLAAPPVRREILGFVEMADFDDLRMLPPVEALPLHLTRSGPAIADAVRILADTDAPALFHCQTGKDRTGALAAVLLRLLGVSEEDALADYLAGADEAEAVRTFLTASGRPFSPRAPLHAIEPPNEAAMRALLERLELEFGGAHAYLRSLDVSEETIKRFAAGMSRN